VLHLEPEPGSKGSSVRGSGGGGGGGGMWRLTLLEQGARQWTVPLSALCDVRLDFVVGHHRHHADSPAGRRRARHHFCLVLRGRPPVALWMPTDAERREAVDALLAALKGHTVPHIAVLRLGMLGCSSHGGDPLVAALAARKLVLFSAECRPLRVLRPVCVVEQPKQRVGLAFEARRMENKRRSRPALSRSPSLPPKGCPSSTSESRLVRGGEARSPSLRAGPPLLPMTGAAHGGHGDAGGRLAGDEEALVQRDRRRVQRRGAFGGCAVAPRAESCLLRGVVDGQLLQRQLVRRLVAAAAHTGASRQ